MRINPYSSRCGTGISGRRRPDQVFNLARTGALTSAFLLLFLITGDQPGSRGVRAQETVGEPGFVRSESLEMLVRAGFGRLDVSSSIGSWVPFRISLVNQGPAIIGRLIVHCESSPNPTPQVREYVKDIQLPTGSRQLHEIAAFLNSGESPIIRVQAGDRVLAETRISVERRYGMSDELDIAVVDTDSTALNNISSAEITRAPNRAPFTSAARSVATHPAQLEAQAAAPPPPPMSQGPQQRRGRFGGPSVGRPVFLAHPIVIAAEDLPREFISYDQFDSVVLGDSPLNQLTGEQARALRLWVASGGLLIITGGADVAGLRAIGLGALLPVEPQATATTESVPELSETYGSFDSIDRLPVMTGQLAADARVLLGRSDNPIAAEKNYGSGIVRFVALNPKLNPYRAWTAAKDLWTDLLLPAAESKPRHSNWITSGRRGNSSSNRWGVQGFLFHLAEIAPPSPKYVLLFLLVYVLTLGPLNYLVLRWKRKTDLAWLTIPAVVITFAVVSITVAQIGRGAASIVADASLAELHQRDGISRATSGVLMIPASKRTQELKFEGGDTYVNDVYNGNQASSASAIGDIECERGPKEFVLRVPMTTWTSGLFQVRSINEGVPALVSVSSAESGVAIKNLSDVPISRAVYLSSAGISDLFDLAPGEAQVVSIAAPQALSFNGWYLTTLAQGTDEAQLFQELGGLLDREVGGGRAFRQGFFDTQLMQEAIKLLDRPLLIGFVDRGATKIDFEGSLKRRSKVLYIVHL
ncbi:MAG: hypothetical protein WAV20_05650 [Blastocatellia bacterium]